MKSDPLENFLRQLDPDRERAAQKYEELRRRLIKFFRWNSCFPAEELVDETFDRVAGKLEEVEVVDVVGFAWGVAKHIRQEANKQAERVIPILDLPEGEDSLPDPRGPDQEVQEKMEDEIRSRCLRRCLQRLPLPDRQLFLRYHNVQGDHTEYRLQLARDMGMTIGTLRVKINRLRDKLEDCVRKHMAATPRRNS